MSTAREKAKTIVGNLISTLDKKGIRVLAVDFDQTLIKIHSGGVWKDSTDNLAKHVRPCMKDLLEVALQREMIVCIVTFHSQPWIIRELLKKLLKKWGNLKLSCTIQILFFTRYLLCRFFFQINLYIHFIFVSKSGHLYLDFIMHEIWTLTSL